jgi:hypothetical protein
LVVGVCFYGFLAALASDYLDPEIVEHRAEFAVWGFRLIEARKWLANFSLQALQSPRQIRN